MKADVTKLFDHFADNAESYGAENLYLARRDEGYDGDPKEFRFSEIYARRIPTYKHELIVDYIDEASTSPHAPTELAAYDACGEAEMKKLLADAGIED